MLESSLFLLRRGSDPASLLPGPPAERRRFNFRDKCAHVLLLMARPTAYPPGCSTHAGRRRRTLALPAIDRCFPASSEAASVPLVRVRRPVRFAVWYSPPAERGQYVRRDNLSASSVLHRLSDLLRRRRRRRRRRSIDRQEFRDYRKICSRISYIFPPRSTTNDQAGRRLQSSTRLFSLVNRANAIMPGRPRLLSLSDWKRHFTTQLDASFS